MHAISLGLLLLLVRSVEVKQRRGQEERRRELDPTQEVVLQF